MLPPIQFYPIVRSDCILSYDVMCMSPLYMYQEDVYAITSRCSATVYQSA